MKWFRTILSIILAIIYICIFIYIAMCRMLHFDLVGYLTVVRFKWLIIIMLLIGILSFLLIPKKN